MWQPDAHVGPTPTMTENSVTYRAFLIPTRQRPSASVEEMTGFRNACLNAVGHRLAGYIWQEDPFALHVVSQSESYGKLARYLLLELHA